MSSTPKYLHIINASEHNLKNIHVDIPHQSLTVITGVSGSGKSSLAYQLIYKESQRRFLESFSSFSRQYLGKLEKPKVEAVRGLQAALAIQQKAATSNPRSTVGTMSGIYDYLRLLFARLGKTQQTSKNQLLANLFSFNSKYGACPSCNGLGLTEQIDKKKLIADENKTLAEGALVPTTPNGYIVYSQVRVDELNKVCRAHDFSVDIPWNKLSKEQQDIIWYGSNKVKILFGKHSLESRLKWKGITAKPREEAHYKGMLPIMEDILHRDRNDNILRFASSFVCQECQGSRLRKEAREVLIQEKNISELSLLSLTDLQTFLQKITISTKNKAVYDSILSPIFKRLEYLNLLGLNYLNLSRESKTLSAGEAHRIKLASQVGSGLQGVLYVLDEPSAGLHHRDIKKLLKVLKSLRDNGNTVVLVEHDEETIKAADYLIDIGPKAGVQGGNLMFQGKSSELFKDKDIIRHSITAKYLAAKNQQQIKTNSRPSIGIIQIKSAHKHNLKSIDITFKLQAFNVVSGVSGAGKSTLVHDILAKSLSKNKAQYCHSIQSDKAIQRIIEIDQSPIGRTPRSNPATYTDLFDHIRDLFGNIEESKKRGYKKGRFSFNNKGGRCEHCQGAGSIHLGMHFLGDVEIICEHCQGKRFNKETLEIEYKGKNIFEVLELSISEAAVFFQGEPKIIKILELLIKLDVGYLKLGQPSTTLSGGEAQRIKLASELYKTAKGHALYILDEPSLGLHKADLKYLLEALNDIVDHNNTVIVIEHDLDIIKQADWVIDLGPEGGDNGGELLAEGTPKQLVENPHSYTGKALKESLETTFSSREDSRKQSSQNNIRFYGVNTHNLQNIDVEIPLNKTTVITGISGSGKSSLAFDTIYSESRNRFTEGFSTYARRMMSNIKKPELEQCTGLSPAIAIRQNRFGKNPRSTLGTNSEIYDLYRLLFSRAGITPSKKHRTYSASMFSFNHIEAACPNCKGLGINITADPKKFIAYPEKSIISGAMDASLPGKFFGDIYGQYVNTLIQVGKEKGIDFSKPYEQLSETEKNIALYGTENEEYDVEWIFKRGNRSGVHKMTTLWKGFVNYLNEEYEIKRKGKRGDAYQLIMSDIPCPDCQGKRLRDEILNVKFAEENISELANRNISNAIEHFSHIEKIISPATYEKSKSIIHQILHKLKQLDTIGLGYLSINRATSSLSGGEAQRLRMATQLSSDLCGITYVLDEPTIGLHSRDTKNLIGAIDQLKNNGNTVIVVEHDTDIMEHADHIIDMGPGAGSKGGFIIAKGSIEEIKNNRKSITAKYLNNNNHTFNKYKTKQFFSFNLKSPDQNIRIQKASANNLKDIDLIIPTDGIIAISGVSGSGKTSLAFDVIAQSFQASLPINCKNISFGRIQSISIMDQQKIGTSPFSTPATYTGIFDLIRQEFAHTSDAKSKGFKKAHFSFNSKEGHCKICKGMGKTKVSLDFLSDVWTKCDSCQGQRYQPHILDIKLHKQNISEVLNLSISEAILFFQEDEKIKQKLEVLEEVGLGYLQLGQATNTLSGGETQRLKLATELIAGKAKNCLYIFDEPTSGLHLQDIERLIMMFRKLADTGNTIILVEHHLEMIKASDWIIDLGPEAGDAGGELIYSGEANLIYQCSKSHTQKALMS